LGDEELLNRALRLNAYLKEVFTSGSKVLQDIDTVIEGIASNLERAGRSRGLGDPGSGALHAMEQAERNILEGKALDYLHDD